MWRDSEIVVVIGLVSVWVVIGWLFVQTWWHKR